MVHVRTSKHCCGFVNHIKRHIVSPFIIDLPVFYLLHRWPTWKGAVTISLSRIIRYITYIVPYSCVFTCTIMLIACMVVYPWHDSVLDVDPHTVFMFCNVQISITFALLIDSSSRLFSFTRAPASTTNLSGCCTTSLSLRRETTSEHVPTSNQNGNDISWPFVDILYTCRGIVMHMPAWKIVGKGFKSLHLACIS